MAMRSVTVVACLLCLLATCLCDECQCDNSTLGALGDSVALLNSTVVSLSGTVSLLGASVVRLDSYALLANVTMEALLNNVSSLYSALSGNGSDSVVLSLLNNTSLVSSIVDNMLRQKYNVTLSSVVDAIDGGEGISIDAGSTNIVFHTAGAEWSMQGTYVIIVVLSAALLSVISVLLHVACYCRIVRSRHKVTPFVEMD